MPSSPKRWQVWNAVKTALAGIAAPTYHFTVTAGAVTIGSQSLEGGERVRLEVFPGAGVHDPEAAESTETLLRFEVFGWLRPNRDEDGFEAIEKLLQDVIRVIHADITLGNIVTRTWCVGTEVDDGLDDLERDWRWCRAEFEIQQFHGFDDH